MMRLAGWLVALALIATPALGSSVQVTHHFDATAAGAPDWREPVATAGALPSCGMTEAGQVRIVLDEDAAYLCNGTTWSTLAGAGGVTDHGALTGLADDDHLQYHTDARAAAWLATQAAGGDLSGSYPAPSVVDDSHAHTGATLPPDDTGTDDQTAAEVPITDVGTFFVGTEVEAALQEIGPTMTDARTPVDDSVDSAALADGDLGQVAVFGGVVTVEGLQYGAAFPLSPATGDVFAVTDDSAAGACDSAAGSALSLCRWDGAAWVALGDGGGAGSSGFADLTSGTNTTAAMVVGAGASLKVGSTGTVDASGLDHDGDGALEASWDAGAGGRLLLNPTDDGSFEWEIRAALILGPATYTFYRGFEPVITVGNTFDVMKNMNIGLQQVNTPFTQTCVDEGTGAAGFLAVTVSGRAFVKLTNADANGCTATLSETGATDGQRLEVVLVSNTGGTLAFADSAGVQETGTGCSLAVWGSSTFRYTSDRWVLTSCQPTN